MRAQPERWRRARLRARAPAAQCLTPRAQAASNKSAAVAASSGGRLGPTLAGVTAGDAKEVWQRVAPGLLEHFDAPECLHAIAPRPLLVIAGQRDGVCPVGGVQEAYATAMRAWAVLGAAPHVRLQVFEGVGHRPNEAMRRAANAWLDKFLLHGGREQKALPDIIYAGGPPPQPEGAEAEQASERRTGTEEAAPGTTCSARPPVRRGRSAIA